MRRAVGFEGAEHLPPAIAGALARFIRRARRLIVARGAGATCTAALGAVLAVMAIDASVTLTEAWMRWALAGLAYGAVLGVAFRSLVRPLARSFTLAGVARLIEQRHPEMHERISSAVELLTSRDLPALRGSEALIQALAGEAAHDADALRPKEEISGRLAVPFVVSAGVLAAVMIGLLLAKPGATALLLARAAVPFLNLSNVQASALTVQPGDTLIAAGSPLSIIARTPNLRMTGARLLQVDAASRTSVAEMIPVPSGDTNRGGRAFAVTLPGVAQAFRYRIRAGGALTRYYTVRVAVPPAIAQLDVQCAYPAYARLPPWRERDGAGTIRALAGTAVSVSAKVNKRVATAELLIRSGGRTNAVAGVAREEAGETFYDFNLSMPAGVDGLWTVRLTDAIGLRNKPFENTIQTLPDLPPRVRMTNLKQREFRLSRGDRLPVRYVAEDDWGLARVELRLTPGGSTNAEVSALAGPTNATQALRSAEGGLQLDLGEARYARVPRLSFRLRAADLRPADHGGPQAGESESITVLLDATALSWREQVLDNQQQRMGQGLADVRKTLKDAKAKSAALAPPLEKPGPLADPALKQAADLQDALAAADTQMRQMAAEGARGYFDALATNLAALAEQRIAPAERLAGQLRLVDQPAERSAIHSNVTAAIDTTLGAVDALAGQFESAQRAMTRAVALERMAREQGGLAQERRAQTSATNAAAQTAQRAAWQKEQERLAAEIAKLAQTEEGVKEEIGERVSRAAAEAAQTAAAVAQRQATNALWMNAAAAALEQQAAERAALAAAQQELAARTEREARAAAESAGMKQAAEDLTAGRLAEARRQQQAAEEALRAQAAEQEKAAAQATAAPPPQTDPAKQAAAAVERSQAAVLAAREAARQAERAGKRAAERAPDAGEAAARPRAELAKAWGEAARQASTRTMEAAQGAREAAAEAAQEGKPEAARRDAAERASRSADEAERFARHAQAFRQQAAREASPNDSPQARAVEAANAAAAAAAAAQRAAVEATRAENRAERTAAAAEQKNEPGAPGADTRARTAAEAAAQSRQEAERAAAAAQAAREAATEALQAESARAAAKQAERAAEEARSAETAAVGAEAAAQRARAAAAPSAQATDQPAQPAAEPRSAAEAAQQAGARAQEAQAAAQEAGAEARAAAQQAAQTAQAAARDAGAAKQQAQQAAAAAQAARQRASQAAEGARQAQEAASRAPATPQARQAAEAERQKAGQAERQAQAAERQTVTAQKAAEANDRSARQAGQAAETAQKAAQRAEELARETGQAAQAAQQAAREATAAPTPQARERAAMDAALAAQHAAEVAREAQQAAHEADRAAAAARHTTEAAGRLDLARRQGDLRAQTQALMSAEQAHQAGMREALSADIGRQQRELAAEATELARTLANEPALAKPAKATEGAGRAARTWERGDAAAAQRVAAQAHDGLAGLAKALADEALAEQPSALPAQRATRARQAQQAEALGAWQNALAEQMAAVDGGRLMDALAAGQDHLTAEAAAVNEQAAVLRDQTRTFQADLPKAAAPAGQAAQRSAEALQQATKADESAAQAAQQASEGSRSRQAAQAAQTAAQQQQAAGVAMQQAAESMEATARDAVVGPAASSAPSPQPEKPDPGRRQERAAVAGALEAALQAAAGQAAMAAAEASAQLAQAAQQAAARAKAMGVTPDPSDPQMTSAGGGGSREFTDKEGTEVGAFTSRFDPRLRSWLRLHGELEHEVLQAQGSEGPEEYRGIIKRYFREVSRRGGEEGTP